MATTSYDLYIGGAWVGAESDEALDVINPATEEAIGQVPQASIADVDRAVAAARQAFDEGPWARMTPRERSDALLRFTQVVADRKAELVDLIIAEAGPARLVADALQFDTGFRYAQWMAERTASFPFQDPLPVQAGARGLGQGVIVKEADGGGGGHHPLQLPALPEPVEGRARAGDGQQRRAQALAVHAAGGVRPRRDRRRGRPAARGPERRHR